MLSTEFVNVSQIAQQRIKNLPYVTSDVIDEAKKQSEYLSSLSEIRTQLQSTKSKLEALQQQSEDFIKNLNYQMHGFEQRIGKLECNHLEIATQSPINSPMKNMHLKEKAFLPQVASRAIRYYFVSLCGLGLAVCLSVLAGTPPESGVLDLMWNLIWRSGFLLTVFLGIVAVEQSIR
jgi:hypothetical protein